MFRSDYVDIYEAARIYNVSFTGQAELQKRFIVERKNKELKNDCYLNHSKTHSRVSLQIKTLNAAMVVNLKHMIRKLENLKPRFIRRAPKRVG